MPERDLTLAAETLGAAEYLLKGGYYNDAVSRAYYAMFYAARALLASRDLHPKGHKDLILQFGLEFVKKGIYRGNLWSGSLSCQRAQGNR
ncbi:MAG: HEPN domain-containing protein [Methanoregula sp.]|nr:HEPN domain-containing protein [Methanoregula sp.]